MTGCVGRGATETVGGMGGWVGRMSAFIRARGSAEVCACVQRCMRGCRVHAQKEICVCIDMCMDMHMNTCMGMRLDMHIDMCIDMRRDICTDM